MTLAECNCDLSLSLSLSLSAGSSLLITYLRGLQPETHGARGKTQAQVDVSASDGQYLPFSSRSALPSYSSYTKGLRPDQGSMSTTWALQPRTAALRHGLMYVYAMWRLGPKGSVSPGGGQLPCMGQRTHFVLLLSIVIVISFIVASSTPRVAIEFGEHDGS